MDYKDMFLNQIKNENTKKSYENLFFKIRKLENALNKNGSFNRNILSKFGLTDEQKKKIDKEYEIQLRKDEASAEIEQSKKNLDNIIKQMDSARNFYSSNKKMAFSSEILLYL